VDPVEQDAFRRHLGLATAAVRARVVPSRARAATGHWKIWLNFCATLHIDPYLQETIAGFDGIPFLQVFAMRYRLGDIAPSGNAVRARTVEDALRSVAQEMAAVGAPDPRLNTFGKIDFRLTSLWRCWKQTDPPPHRVKPVPLKVLRRLTELALTADRAPLLAVVDMIIVAFFFLLRPGEYTGSSSNTTPFALKDTQLFIGRERIAPAQYSEPLFDLADFVTLEFTTQKNGVRGEVIGLGCTGDYFSPVKALQRRIRHLLEHDASPDTPLASYFTAGRWHRITPSQITTALRSTVATFDPNTLGFNPKDVSARSLRAAGAMALLCAHVDTDIIRLVGRWRSDEMLRYLHVQAEPIMRDFSKRMVAEGDFNLLPNSLVPMA
jgi:hypothetical protein